MPSRRARIVFLVYKVDGRDFLQTSTLTEIHASRASADAAADQMAADSAPWFRFEIKEHLLLP